MQTGGFSNWEKVPATSWVFNEMFDFDIKVAAIFDRDYRSDDEVNAFLADVATDSLFCRVLPCKEIENILLSKTAIFKAVSREVDSTKFPNWSEELEVIVESEIQARKGDVLACRIGQKTKYVQRTNPNFDPTTLAKSENRLFEAAWNSPEFRMSVVPGKQVLAFISGSVKTRFNVSLTAAKIAAEMTEVDLGIEFCSILSDLRSFYIGQT